MTPNQNVPFWEYAEFCNDNPLHELCASLSGIHEFEGFSDMKRMRESVISQVDRETGEWVHDIHVDGHDIPSWNGQLHLRYIPKSVRSLSLHGMNLTVHINELQGSLLKLLKLDFERVVGISVAALTRLSGLQLEILRLPSAELRQKDVHDVLRMMDHSRATGSIHLNVIELAGGKRIVYDFETGRYVFWSVESSQAIEYSSFGL